MSKKKILFHSNHSRAFTGFGKNLKNILKYLSATGKYEIVEYASGLQWSNPDLKKLPWKAYGSLPDNQFEIYEINKDPRRAKLAAYGEYNINKLIKLEKPDIYFGIEDFWGIDYCLNKSWWNKINCIVHTTLDSLPLFPPSIQNASKIKHYYVWADFATKELHRLGHTHVKTLHGAIDHSNFYRLKDNKRSEIRKLSKIPKDAFIIGFVFRNQLRKSVPNLLKGFKQFINENPEVNGYLLLHSNWNESAGWDIRRLIKDNGIDPKRVLTTYFCKSCNNYTIKHFEGPIECPFCGAKDFNTIDIGSALSEVQLNEIYNVMDVYCHPFTSGGQEIPVQEAKLCELVTLVTNYSCGEEYCTSESGGLPLEWAEYSEQGSQFIKASTYPSSIAKQLKKVFNMKGPKRKEMGGKARQYVIDNCSIPVIGKKLEELFDSLPEVNYDFETEEELKDPEAKIPEIKDNSLWIKTLYKKILKLDVLDDDKGLLFWLEKLKNGDQRDNIENHFRKVAIKENHKNKKVDFQDMLAKDDEGRRILVVMPKSIGDIYILSSTFKSLKEQYPWASLYVATEKKYHFVLEGNPYVDHILTYISHMDHQMWLEGAGEEKGYFEIAFMPHTCTQRMSNYLHNGKTNIAVDLNDQQSIAKQEN